MRKSMWVAGAAMIVAAGGCASVGRQAFREPVVTLRDVKLTGVGLTGGSLDVVLSVFNPNGYRLDATRMTYKLLVDTVRFAQGTVDNRFTVMEKDSSVVHIPVSFTYAGVGQAGRELMNTGSVNYRVLGDVTVGSPLGSFTFPYDRNGRFTALAGRSQ